MLGSGKARDGKWVLFILGDLGGLSKDGLAEWRLKCQEAEQMGKQSLPEENSEGKVSLWNSRKREK